MPTKDIISVEVVKLDKPIPVYDLTVPEYSNFCLGNGVVVHNCERARFKDFQASFALRGKPLNCLSGDVKVKNLDGDTALSDIKGPWQGLGFSVEEKISSVDNFTAPVITKFVQKLLVLELADGSKIRCTPDHLFLTKRGYVEAQNLSNDDELVTA